MSQQYDEGSEADFAQSLMEDGVMDWLLDNPARESAAPAEEATRAEQPRDDQGRFVAEEEEVPAEEPVAAEEVALEDEEDSGLTLDVDGETLQILEKYGNDLNKALKALQDSQSFIGKQGSELGELRKQVEALEAARQAQQVIPQAPPPWMPYQNDIDENPQGLVFEAMQRGDGQTMHAALKAWGEEAPFEAAMFASNLQMQMAEEERRMAQAQQAPAYEQQAPEPTLEDAMRDVATRNPDIEKYLPKVGEVAGEFPSLRGLMERGTPLEKAQAFEELVKIARSRDTETSEQAVRRVALRTQEEVAKEKAGARVVSGRRQSPGQESRSDRTQQFYDAFDQAAGRWQNEGWISFDPSWENDRSGRPF